MDTLDKVQGAQSDWTMSMDLVAIVHCLPGQCPWTPWTMYMDLVESLDNVHGYSGQSPGSPLRLNNVHGLSGQSVSLENAHGLPGQCPWTQWKDWTMSTESMGSLDIVHGQSPPFFLTELVTKKNLSWSSLS